MPINRDEPEERLARIEQMIEEFREAKQRELVRWGRRLWRRAEARQQIVALEAEPERIH
jgi:hypothetical protein